MQSVRYRWRMIETIAGHLTFEREDRVALVTVNRPEARNAMTFEMYERLHDLCERYDKDPAVRVLVLTGAGDKAFVSGTDIRQFLAFKTKEDALGYEARITRVLSRIHAMTKPTIAMIQGDAVGGGMFMSLACDLRAAAEHARFGARVVRCDVEDGTLEARLSAGGRLMLSAAEDAAGSRVTVETEGRDWHGVARTLETELVRGGNA